VNLGGRLQPSGWTWISFKLSGTWLCEGQVLVGVLGSILTCVLGCGDFVTIRGDRIPYSAHRVVFKEYFISVGYFL